MVIHLIELEILCVFPDLESMKTMNYLFDVSQNFREYRQQRIEKLHKT